MRAFATRSFFAGLIVAATTLPASAAEITTDGQGNVRVDGEAALQVAGVKGTGNYVLRDPKGRLIGVVVYLKAENAWEVRDLRRRALKKDAFGEIPSAAGELALAVLPDLLRTADELAGAASQPAAPAARQATLGPKQDDGWQVITLDGQVVGKAQVLPTLWSIADPNGRSIGKFAYDYDAGKWTVHDGRFRQIGTAPYPTDMLALLAKHFPAMAGTAIAPRAGGGTRHQAIRRASRVEDLAITETAKGARFALEGQALGRVEQLTAGRWVVRDHEGKRLGHLDVDGASWGIVDSTGATIGSVTSNGRMKLSNGYSRSLPGATAADVAAHAFFGPGAD